MSQEDIQEFIDLADERERAMASAYRKQCQKNDVRPIPPSKWLVCPACQTLIDKNGHTELNRKTPYRAPLSLVNHIKEHGGLEKVAAICGKLPEQITLIADELNTRFKTAGNNSIKK
jgi:hypothetical protein